MVVNASREAAEKLNSHLPPDAPAGKDEELRRRMEELDDEVRCVAVFHSYSRDARN